MNTDLLMAERETAEQSLVASERRYQSLLASTIDYVYTVTLDGRRSVSTSHGSGCEAVTGFTSPEFDANPMLWYRMIHDDDRPAVLAHIARIVNGEMPRPLEHRIIHKDGDVRWIRNVPVPQHDPTGRVVSYNGLISDITERKRAEQLLAAQYSVTRQLAASGTFPDTLHRILQALCETFAWDWAAFWSFEAKANTLQWSGIWYCPSSHWEEFEQASRTLNFASGVSLPGRAWAGGQPEWIPDVAKDQHFLRAAIAARIGLHGACTVPIRRANDIRGVIELFSRKVLQPDPQMMQMLTAVGAQIGQFLDRTWAEEALTTERNLLRTLIDTLPDYVYAKDTASRFLLNNLAHLRVLGAASPQETIAKTDLDFFPSELALRYRADEEAMLKSGLPIVNREEPVIDPDGNQQWVLTTKVPWKDSQGSTVGLIGVSRDITERKRLEEKQRISEERLQAILDNAPAVVYLKDIQGRYLLVNRQFEALFHLTHEKTIGTTDYDLFPQEQARLFRANDEKVIACLGAMEFEEVAPHDDGPHTYISVKFPLVNADGVAYALCGISTDISERKRAEERLQQACIELRQSEGTLTATLQELKATHEELKATELQLIQAAKLECIGTLAAGVAHEVKNPLQTMLMGLHYLTQNLPAPNEGIALALQDMREAVTRANTILRGLLELSADTKSELKAEDLNACVERSLWLLQYELVATQTTVVRRLASELPPVLMDRGKMEQVFINLFLNALQAMSHCGTLTVTTRVIQCPQHLAAQELLFRPFKPGANLAVLEVQDTGTGIPDLLLPKVFDPFFTTKLAGHGTGLGLAVVKKIVDLHGGAIELRNAPPRGALATLILKLE
jgi:PAS domain S-box-containing protein